ncbi:MAG: hypothetical protein KGL53_11375, partial [Elusimicrobia bacterium]|nr:hypothetical protein [Elusimicrobiota bacterium]
VAVVTPESIGGGDATGPQAVSERLVTRLAEQPGLQVVERSLLDRVLKEQKLAGSGAVDPHDAPAVGRLLGVQAVVTGTLLPESSGRVELNMRLIDSSQARVLGAAVAQVRQDWSPEPAPAEAPAAPPLQVPPPPSLDTDFTAFWDKPSAPSDPRCADWEAHVDQLQVYSLPLEVRFWAARLRRGLDLRTLTHNPGSDIRSLQTRAAFYAGVRQAAADGDAPLSAAELGALKLARAEADGLTRLCGG